MDEISLFVQMKRDWVDCKLLDALGHRQLMIQDQFEATLELLNVGLLLIKIRNISDFKRHDLFKPLHLSVHPPDPQLDPFEVLHHFDLLLEVMHVRALQLIRFLHVHLDLFLQLILLILINP